MKSMVFINRRRILWVLLITVVAILRFTHLDGDSLPRNQAGAAVLDEPYYCLTAIQSFHEDKGTLLEGFSTEAREFMSFHNEWPMIFSLKLLGHNYYGLRTYPVILSLLSISILLLVLFKLKVQPELIFLLFVYLSFDYYFFQFSRFQTPQIYSIFWLTCVVLLMFYYQKDSRIIIPTFAIAVWMIFLVYPYMLFILPALGIWTLLEYYFSKQRRLLIYSMIGVALGVVLVILILLVGGYTPLDYSNWMLGRMSIRNEVPVGSEISLLTRLFQLSHTSLFRYNPMLYLSMIVFIGIGVTSLKRISSFERFIWVAIVFLYTSSFFILSYPFKKWIIALPFAFLTLPLNFKYLLELTDKRMKYWLFMLIFVAAVLQIHSIRVNNSPVYWAGPDLPFEPLSSLTQFLLYSEALIGSVVFLSILFSGKKALFISGIALLTSVQIFLTVRFLSSPKYLYRDSLIANAQLFDQSAIVGSFSHSCVLYSNNMLTFNPYDIGWLHLKEHDVMDNILSLDNGLPRVYYFQNRRLENMDSTMTVHNMDFVKCNAEPQILQPYILREDYQQFVAKK